MHSSCWLVSHDTMGCLFHCTSVWYFCLQVLWCRSRSVGCGGNSAGVLCLDSVCYAVKGKICHTLWTQFAVQSEVKFNKLRRRLCHAVSGKCPYTELCFLCSQRKSVKLSCWPGFLLQCFAICSHQQRFQTPMGLLARQNYDYCWDQCIWQSS